MFTYSASQYRRTGASSRLPSASFIELNFFAPQSEEDASSPTVTSSCTLRPEPTGSTTTSTAPSASMLLRLSIHISSIAPE